jgi:ribonuclease HI
MLTVYIDGGSRGNPGPAAIGFVIFDKNLNEVHRFGRKVGVCTNNCAEYRALIEALHFLAVNDSLLETCREITVFSDSELLVHQMNGRYRVRDPKLILLHRDARDLQSALSVDSTGNIRTVRIRHIARENNRTADRVVNKILDGGDYFN